MPVAEEAQEQGRQGVMDVKRWLEATMRFDVRYTVYDQADRVTLPLLNGKPKRYDAVAQHYRDDPPRTPSGRDVYVEVKTLGSPSSAKKQTSQFREFAATAYSAMAQAWVLLGRDPDFDFMFATTHPWEVDRHLELTTAAYVEEACAHHAPLLGQTAYDVALGATLASHLWIWIIPGRQDEMTMGPAHIGHVWRAIKGAA